MKAFIELEEAINILNDNFKALEVEEVSLIDSIGRIINNDIYSEIENPPFNKSAMDGYAIKIESNYEELEVIDEVFAGTFTEKEVTEGTCIKIMTGAPIPKGANAVIKKEDVTVNNNSIKINKNIKENENICFKGEDIKSGTLLINKGKKLDYADIGILASAGISKVKVYRKPKVSFISTGDEVVDINKELDFGKIYNSNKYSIIGRIKELGYEVSFIDHEGDGLEVIGDKIKKATEVSNLVITTGGVSVGDKDLLKEAIDYIGGEKLFWKVNIKPGSAVLCSKVNNKPIISLSGNPTAALTTFELLAKTVLEKLSGEEEILINREKAILVNGFSKSSKNRRFLRGHVYINGINQYVEITQVKSGNGILSSALNSNCLIEVEGGNEGLKENDIVNIIKF